MEPKSSIRFLSELNFIIVLSFGFLSKTRPRSFESKKSFMAFKLSFFIFNKTVFFANAKLLKLSVLVWQGGGAKVSVGEVSDLLAGEERAQLPRLLLPAEGGFRRRAQDSAPAQSRDLQLSQQGEYIVH